MSPGARGTGVALTGGGLGPPRGGGGWRPPKRCSRASTGSTRDHSRHWFCEAARTNSARSSAGTCETAARKVRIVVTI